MTRRFCDLCGLEIVGYFQTSTMVVPEKDISIQVSARKSGTNEVVDICEKCVVNILINDLPSLTAEVEARELQAVEDSKV